MNTALFLQTIDDGEGPLRVMATDTIERMNYKDFEALCADMQRLVELDEEVVALGAKIPVINRSGELVTGNHEMWKECPLCLQEYDMKYGGCPECAMN